MMSGLKLKLSAFLIVSCSLLLAHQKLLAENFQPASYSEMNLSFPRDSQAIDIFVSHQQSEKLGWRAGQQLQLALYTESANGRLETFFDAENKYIWDVTLDSKKEAVISVVPGPKNATGKLVVKANGKILSEGANVFGDTNPKIAEKIYEYRFGDGVKIKVHYTDQMLQHSGETSYFAKDVLDAAVQAYQTITQFEGFSSTGYSFAFPDPSYAYDPDRTIDIFLGDPSGDSEVLNHGFNNLSFKDAPCFDTLKISDKEYQAVILLPSNYKEFIKNWERINPSSLGARNVNVDLRGTLIHEMLHVILFYYNKNLNKDTSASELNSTPGLPSVGRKVDWYVEGLARYFETFAGAKHDFFSQGFKQTLPDKIRFSRGGSNYFMRYPDQAFTDLRYENALFWRFIDYRFGMSAIERLSRDFRDFPNRSFEFELQKATQIPFKDLLKNFAISILLKDFGLKEDQANLKDIAKTRLIYKKGELYLCDGAGEEKNLGKVCRTDWVGQWENVSARFGEPPVAGDNTEKADVSGWATDYIEITLDGNSPDLPVLSVEHSEGGEPLAAQLVMVTKGGSLIKEDLGDIPSAASKRCDLRKDVTGEGLSANDIEKIYLLITNSDPRVTSDYKIVVSE